MPYLQIGSFMVRVKRSDIRRAAQIVCNPEHESLRSTLIFALRPDIVDRQEFDTYGGSGRGFFEAVELPVTTQRFAGSVAVGFANHTSFDEDGFGDTLPTQERLIIRGQVGELAISYDDQFPLPPREMPIENYQAAVLLAMWESIRVVQAERGAVGSN